MHADEPMLVCADGSDMLQTCCSTSLLQSQGLSGPIKTPPVVVQAQGPAGQEPAPHTHTPARAHPLSLTYTHTYTHAHIHIHVHAHTRTRNRSHHTHTMHIICTRARTHAVTRTRSRTSTHAGAHIQSEFSNNRHLTVSNLQSPSPHRITLKGKTTKDPKTPFPKVGRS